MAADVGAADASDSRDDRAHELMARIKETEDFYKILGVARDADDSAIKKAYRKAALVLHPDKCSIEGAKEGFQKVSTAFQCLSDAEQRAYYDRTGRTRNDSSAVGQAHDAEDIFRAFFGEDFDGFADGGGGVRFHTFSSNGGMSGQTFVFNMGGGGMPGGFGGFGPQGRRNAQGAGGGIPVNPGILGGILSIFPAPVVILAFAFTFFWGFFWFLRHVIYFLPVFYLAPPRFKLPLCFLVWLAIMTGRVGSDAQTSDY